MHLVLQPTIGGNVDPAVFAALPPSMQHQLLVRVSVLYVVWCLTDLILVLSFLLIISLLMVNIRFSSTFFFFF